MGFRNHRRQAQASLSLVILIGGIVILVGITVAFVALTFLNSSYGFQASNRAYGSAMAGIHDAMLQLIRNQSFSSSLGYCVPANGTPCPDNYALVTVTQNSPSSGQVLVVSDVSVSKYRRKLQAAISVSSSTGEVDLISVQTLSL